MKIISKFSDYYDVGLSYGIDEKLRFVRETKKLKEREGTVYSFEFKKGSENCLLTIHKNIIGFCGDIYPFVQIILYEVTKKDKKPVYKEKLTLISYKKEELFEFIEHEYMSFDEIEKKYKYNYSIGRIKKVLELNFTREMKFDERYKVPYYCIINEGLPSDKKHISYTLPLLKKYHFSKVLAPLEAFQKLTMYLGAVNLKENELVNIEDKYLAQGKGFDCYSFRKMPSKRRLKRC